MSWWPPDPALPVPAAAALGRPPGPAHAPPPAPAGAPPAWLNHRLAALTGLMLALLMAAGAAVFLRLAHAEALAQEHRSARLMARVLEDHVTRTLVSAELVLMTLSESALPLGEGAALDAALRHALPGQPALRSVSMLAADGRVLASSNPENEQLRLAPAAWPLAALAGEHWLGTPLAARDLVDLAPRADGTAPRRSPAELILLVRRVVRGDGPVRYLVAALNPDAMANHFRMATQDSGFAGLLFNTAGRALVAHPSADGASLSMPLQTGHEVFARQLPQAEHGSLVARGALHGAVNGRLGGALVGAADGAADGAGDALVAFRASRVMPVVAWVEKPMPLVLAGWRTLLGQVLGALLAGWLVVGALTLAAWRSLRARWQLTLQLARADARTVARERELRRLVDGVHEVLLRTDADGQLSFANQRMLELTGRLEADLLGQPLWMLVAPADRQAVQARLRGRDNTAAPLVVTLLSDGAEAPCVELSLSWHAPGPDEAGSYLGFAVDVSAREQARRELKRQLEFSRTVLQVLPVPVFVTDRQGRCLATNRAWEQFTGLSAAAVVGRRLEPGLAPTPLVEAHRAHEFELLHGHLRDSHDALQLLRADGQMRDVEISKIALRQRDGHVVGLVGSIHDVTEFLQAQRVMGHARDAAEASDRVKSGFIANVSHELRTPLQSILGFSELALRRAMPIERLRDVLQDIHRSGDRMLTLVNEVLDVSKFDSALANLTLEPADPCALAAEVVHELSPIAQQRQIRVLLQPPEQALQALLNRFRFAQVVRNVLANALRFSSAGGTVWLALAQTPAGDRQPAEISLCVIDEGPGVPPAELQAIFEPFTQSTRTGDGAGGTGLGLTIARSIMKAHGGRIWAHNRPEGGAVFTLCLPACAATSLASKAQAGAPDGEAAVATNDNGLQAQAVGG
ncbi:PAS domain-containing sensor histidine kinase [Aquabacterium sp. OR-4]|uniref:PAS domain-containing sensor histidine kinase n=1 Tax=Aquabacterium sp. OR-4 TaxID=2978127 RepID=UPI0021B2BC1A|nr:PAS domain-containing sensor histidine kinase [Aquabacterium sp. OR-4]MDT7837330.1 PAS domain-containing sensor histidine kinase [Aquabacterium sp. OR-4]